MLKKFATLITAVAVLTIGIVASARPALADSCHTDLNGHLVCDVVAGGGGGGGSTGGSGGTSSSGFTPGPTTCTFNDKSGTQTVIPCSSDQGWWSNSQQCYWSLVEPQGPPPSGKSATVGAWYICVNWSGDPFCIANGCYSSSVWLDSPPPGISRYTPAQAAGMLIKTFQLNPIPIGMAPAAKVHTDDPAGTAPYRRTWVGIPVWLWVDSPSNSQWGPISASATYGGVTVSATATVISLVWNSGDGQTVTCGLGTPFNAVAMANQAAVDSPTCGFRYQNQSAPGTFTVTATSTWSVQWNGGGQSGNVAMPSTSSSVQVHVGELQSVNTAVAGDTYVH